MKNLRGVIYSCLDEGAFSSKLSWLRRRFRYRSLGLPPCMLERYGQVVRGMLGPNLIELHAPLPGLEGLISAYSRILKLGQDVIEAYCFASIYVSPLMVLGGGCLGALGPLIIDRVLVGGELTDKDYKLHMRIADYTVLDFYLWATSSAQEAVMALSRGEDIKRLLEERRERIEKDKHRYWRIISEQGRPLVLYLDLLPLLAANLSPEEAGELVRSYESLVPATLAIVSAIVI
mgnify:CR=1 FL=1